MCNCMVSTPTSTKPLFNSTLSKCATAWCQHLHQPNHCTTQGYLNVQLLGLGRVGIQGSGRVDQFLGYKFSTLYLNVNYRIQKKESMQFKVTSLYRWPPCLDKPLLHSMTQIYLHFSLPFQCTHATEILGRTGRLTACYFKCYFLTVDIPKILWLWIYPRVTDAQIPGYKIFTHPSPSNCMLSTPPLIKPLFISRISKCATQALTKPLFKSKLSKSVTAWCQLNH